MRRVFETAGLNADKVDGRHAVGFTNKRSARAGRLVATNSRGDLPSNIVRPYWGLIKNRPAILADNKISWGEVANKPSGFADGVDNAGVTSLQVRRVERQKTVARGGGYFVFIDCPSGSFVVGGGFETPFRSVSVHESSPSDRDTWLVVGYNDYTSSAVVRAYAICLTATPAKAISGSSNY